jgi:chorismate synthase
MSIHAIKGVDGRWLCDCGQAAQGARRDRIKAGWRAQTDQQGGRHRGRVSPGSDQVRAAMKPISTVPRAATVDVRTGEKQAINQRSDVTRYRGGVVAEAMVALVLPMPC